MRTPLEDHLKEYANDPEYAREYDKAWVKTKKEVSRQLDSKLRFFWRLYYRVIAWRI